ncbi:MAG: FAD:protein FMN transferase [Sedimentisphaerales bacterium]
MENESRRRALKFFVTACVISAMYYFIMETFGPVVEVDGGSREIIGAPARIVAVAKNDRKAKLAIKAGFDELTRIAKLMSEEPNKVNHEAFVGPVKVSPELFEVLQIGIDYSKLTKGAFDITVADANGHGGYEKLILDINNKTVRFAAQELQLDLSGIAKGYAIDKAVEIMKRKGAIGGLVDAGGIIRCFGRPAHGGNWLIGNAADSVERIADSVDSNKPGMVLKLRDMAVVAKPGGVTIIAPKAVVAEVIASAVGILGAQKGLDLVDSLLGVEAIIVTPGPGYRVIKSRGADAYLQ